MAEVDGRVERVSEWKIDGRKGPRWVVRDDGCWEWQLFRSAKGYGHTRAHGRGMSAHRAAWIARNGELPEGTQLHHRCRNPGCVNPDHLELTTWAVHQREHQLLTPEQVRDIRDRYVRGRNGFVPGTSPTLAHEYGISISMVQKIVAREHYAWVQ